MTYMANFFVRRFVLEFPRFLDTSDFKIFRNLIFSEIRTDICEASLKILGLLKLAFVPFYHQSVNPQEFAKFLEPQSLNSDRRSDFLNFSEKKVSGNKVRNVNFSLNIVAQIS
jgi:hypothetical protein